MKLLLPLVLAFTLQTASAQWEPLFKSRLQDLQSRPTNEIAYAVYEIAMTWAAAGHMRQANELLTQFWKYGVTDPNDFQHFHDGLQVLWTLSGQRPETSALKLRNVD